MENKLLPKELRIGNLVKLMLNHEDYEILSVKIEDLAWIEKLQGEYEPILLTEEWLTRFGFVRINHQMSLNDGSMTYHYELNGDNRFWQLYFNGRAFSINEPKFRHHLYHNQYVHQLQNLYFALTGEELTIKN